MRSDRGELDESRKNNFFTGFTSIRDVINKCFECMKGYPLTDPSSVYQVRKRINVCQLGRVTDSDYFRFCTCERNVKERPNIYINMYVNMYANTYV